MDENHPATDRLRDNVPRHGQRPGHSWRPDWRWDYPPDWRQDIYSFTPHHHLHPSASHFQTEGGIQPQSVAATILPPFNTIISPEPPPSTPFLSSPLCPNISNLRPNRLHNREHHYVPESFSHDHHRPSSSLQLPSPQIPSSRGLPELLIPASRPPSRLSWISEDASVSTLFPGPSQFQDSFIDLTTASSSPLAMPPESRKRDASRSRVSDHAPVSSSKRAKLEDRQTEGELKDIAELDLREVDDDESFARIIEEQRIASVKAQHEQAEKPVNFSSLQCIICMEPMTNITVTHCGTPIKPSHIEEIEANIDVI